MHAAGDGRIRAMIARACYRVLFWSCRGSAETQGRHMVGSCNIPVKTRNLHLTKCSVETHLVLRLLRDFDRHGLLGRLLHAGRRGHGSDGALSAIVDVGDSPPPTLLRHYHARNGCRSRGAGKEPNASRDCKSPRHGSRAVHRVVVEYARSFPWKQPPPAPGRGFSSGGHQASPSPRQIKFRAVEVVGSHTKISSCVQGLDRVRGGSVW